MSLVVSRYHDISCGHRVAGHEGKCQGLHGHNYRIHFDVASETGALDALGRVVDFGVIKSTLCQWLEDIWDHNMLLWAQDPILPLFAPIYKNGRTWGETPADDLAASAIRDSLCVVPFNPTAENMAEFLLNTVGPSLLTEHGLKLTRVRIEETRKCSATASL